MSHVENALANRRIKDNLKIFYDCDLVSQNFYARASENVHIRNFLTYCEGFCDKKVTNAEIDHALLIVFANRSGSNFLSRLIASTGHYNFGGETVNWATVKPICDKRKYTTFAAYLDFLKRQKEINGRFSIKVSLTQYLFLYAASFLDSHFPQRTVVVVDRSDKIAQAISYWIADHTKQWTSVQETKWTGEIPFDGGRIVKLIQRAVVDEQDTRMALTLLGQPFVTARYEEFVQDPLYVVTRILRESGVMGPVEIDAESIALKKQATDLNETLREKLMSHLRSAGDAPLPD